MLGHRQASLDDYLGILRRRWILILSLTIVGGGLGFGVLHYIPKSYTSQTVVLVQEPTVPSDYVKPVVSDTTSERLASMQQEILSRSRLEPIIQQYALYQDQGKAASMDDKVALLQGAITVTPVQAMAETRANGLPGFTI